MDVLAETSATGSSVVVVSATGAFSNALDAWKEYVIPVAKDRENTTAAAIINFSCSYWKTSFVEFFLFMVISYHRKINRRLQEGKVTVTACLHLCYRNISENRRIF